MKWVCVLLAAGMGHCASAETFDCFTVVDPRGEVVYKANRSPIDLSKTISSAMAASYPGYHLIWSQTDDRCTAVDRLPSRADTAAATQAPATTTAAAGEVARRDRPVTRRSARRAH